MSPVYSIHFVDFSKTVIKNTTLISANVNDVMKTQGVYDGFS